MEREQIEKLVEAIPMTRVFSSNLVAMGYNETEKAMRVIFKGNSSYIYFDVEPEVWNIISNSQSKGRTLSECVIKQKEKYKYIKL